MGDRRDACRLLLGRPEGKNHTEDLGVDGSIMLKWLFKKWDGGHGLDYSVLNRDRWLALVDAVMNLRVPLNVGNFLTS
jgi:hypothetical protein